MFVNIIGTFRSLFGFNTPYAAFGGAAPKAVVDLTGDGVPEVLFVGSQTALPQPLDPSIWSDTPVIIYTKIDGRWIDASELLVPNPDSRHIGGLGASALIADFNKDGFIDFLLPGGTDSAIVYASYLFQGSAQGFVRKEVAERAWVHGSSVGDLNLDGYPDVVLVGYPGAWLDEDAQEEPGIQIGFGGPDGLTFYPVDFSNLDAASGVLIGDFIKNDQAKAEIVFTDGSGWSGQQSSDASDTLLLSWDIQNGVVRLSPEKILPGGYFYQHPLTGFSGSHDIRAFEISLDPDNLPDVMVVSLPGARNPGYQGDYTPHSSIQFLKNLGSGNFSDVTNQYLYGYSTETSADYFPQFIDVNRDGAVDIYLAGGLFYSSRLLIRQDNGSFIEKNRDFFTAIYEQVYSRLGFEYQLREAAVQSGGARLVPVDDHFDFLGIMEYEARDIDGHWRQHSVAWSVPIVFDQAGTAYFFNQKAGRDFNADGSADLLWRNDNGMVAIWEMNGLTQKASAVVATIPNEWKIVDGAGDYDGDGKSDLLWRNDNGMVAIWEMNGLTQKASAVVATIPNEWKIVDGAGDYDGDGKSDLLWRNDNGMVAIWEMNGLTQKASAVVATIPNEWKIVDGAGDYDGDGKSDLLWRNDNGMVAIWEMDGLTQKASAVVATIPNEWKIVDGAGDYDGDGKSDLLWRNDNGMVAIWEMNGLTQKASAVVATIPNEWKIVDGEGDYDGDGKSDLLWRNDNGMVAIWEMNGLTQKASAVVATIPNEWKIQGGVIQSTNTRRDYDGDGKSDLLWRNDSGMVAIWEMNGLTQKASAVVATIPNEWKIVDGAGDYDGDGKSDLLWRNDNGMVAIWEMNGLTQKASAVVATIPNEWKIVDGAGDYDGDGKSDLLWRNDNGMVAIWEMNGLTQKASAVVATIPTEWKIVDGAGDYDGDGKSDLLWRNDNGMVAIWEMDGLTQKAAAVVATIPNEWKIVDGAGDYDGDGKSDLLWRNDNGMVAIWEMNGLTQKASAVVATIPNEWKIVDGAGDYDGDGKSDLLWRNDNGMMAIWEMDGLTQKASAVVATIPNEWFLIP